MVFAFFQNRDKKDKQRLEAFMDALPMEYCGWSAGGTAVWSRGFPKLFGLPSIQTIRDIQQAILPSDAAALEGMIFSLKKNGEEFSLTVKTTETDRFITLYGSQGQDMDGGDHYDVLWAEDTTYKKNDQDDVAEFVRASKKTADFYQSILNHLPHAVWTLDEAKQVGWCNDTYQKLIDKPREDLVDKPDLFQPILTQPEKISLQNMAVQALAGDTCDQSTGRLIVEGKRRLMDLHVAPVIDEGYAVNAAFDITEQEDLRAELKRYVAANAELLEQISTAIAIFAADHKLEFYNQAFASLWGLEDQWLNTNPPLGDILEKLREMRRLPEQANFRDYKKQWLDLFTSLMDQHQDMLHLPDGVAIRQMIVPHPMGGLMMMFEDVTSRLELESSYNTLIAVQRETLDNLAEGVAVFGSDARLRLYNPSYLKLWEFNPEDTDKNPHIIELVEKKKKFFKGKKIKWDKVADQLKSHALTQLDKKEILVRSDDIILECSSVTLPDGGVMVTYRDVSDSIRVQQALEDKNQALLDAEKLKTDFLANVSYQLRTPLNAIGGFSEILNNEYFGEINDKQREYTQGITDAAEQLATLIDDILDLSSIEAGYLRLDKAPVDILSLMNKVYDRTHEWAGMESLKIDYKKPKKSPGEFMLDERRVKQAVINIIRNAISYTPEGGKITLSLTDDKDKILITIADTGIGIPDDEQDKIFEPFKTISGEGDADSVSARAHTGLGLSLAKNIIAMHDGDIDIKSILGEGTTVSITLPK